MKAVVVPARQGEAAVRDLLNRGMVQKNLKMEQRGDLLVLPIIDCAAEEAESLGYRVEEVPDLRERHNAIAHFVRIRAKALVPEHLKRYLPESWERLGDVLVIRFPPALADHERELARVYAEVVGAEAVVAERGPIRGELRRPDAELLFGGSSETMHLENGVRYWLDPRKVMFSSGNLRERMRMGSIPMRGEVVADMFAGVGYFTLPMAFHGGATVHAFEKNPDAFTFLERNILENRLVGRVTPHLMDNRDAPEGFADRVVMGYIGGTASFLPKALRMLRGKGIVHYHEVYRSRLFEDGRQVEGELWEKPLAEIEDAVKGEGGAWTLLAKHRVKGYSRYREHVVVDFEYRTA